MKQDKIKTQDETHIEQDELLFNSQAIKEAKQVIPMSESKIARNSDETNYPRVAIEGFRRKLSPFGLILIAVFSIALLVLSATIIYKDSPETTATQDINDEAVIPTTGGDSVGSLTDSVQEAASFKAISESKKQPAVAAKTEPKKPVSNYTKPVNQDYLVIRNNDFERDDDDDDDDDRNRIYIEDRIFNNKKLERKMDRARKRYDRKRESKRERKDRRKSKNRKRDD